MKHGKLLVLMGLFGNLSAFAAETTTIPAWMNTTIEDITPPSAMSGSEQDDCTDVILDQISKRTKVTFTREDVAEIQMPNWTHSEYGFVRGGGYNIRIATTLTDSKKQLKHLKSGRFTDFMGFLKLGDEPSLHIPSNINGEQTFILSDDETGTHVDFVAHVDSSYAYLPLGLFQHLFKDVLGAATRNPCPVQGGESKND